MDHIVPMIPRHDCGVGTIVFTAVLLLSSGMAEDAVGILPFEKVGSADPELARDVWLEGGGGGGLSWRAGQVYVAICARRSTVSSGKRNATSRPADRKP